MSPVTVRKLLDDSEYHLDLSVIGGADYLDRVITNAGVHKLGLSLTGIRSVPDPGQIQVMGGAEIAYLQMISTQELSEVVEKLIEDDFSCLITTRGLTPPVLVVTALEKKQIPALKTPLDSAEFFQRVTGFLDDQLAPRISFHGVLVDVIGIGVLILGDSGIGKSETALDLILKGHRLVADDIVEVQRRANASLLGMASDMLKHHMEIRGLGIINVPDLFGVSAISDQKKIDLVVELSEWVPDEDYDRLGLDEEAYLLLGLEVPLLRVPVRPGRNLSSIIEVAARNQLLKLRGRHAAHEFQQKLIQRLVTAADQDALRMDEVD